VIMVDYILKRVYLLLVFLLCVHDGKGKGMSSDGGMS